MDAAYQPVPLESATDDDLKRELRKREDREALAAFGFTVLPDALRAIYVRIIEQKTGESVHPTNPAEIRIIRNSSDHDFVKGVGFEVSIAGGSDGHVRFQDGYARQAVEYSAKLARFVPDFGKRVIAALAAYAKAPDARLVCGEDILTGNTLKLITRGDGSLEIDPVP